MSFLHPEQVTQLSCSDPSHFFNHQAPGGDAASYTVSSHQQSNLVDDQNLIWFITFLLMRTIRRRRFFSLCTSIRNKSQVLKSKSVVCFVILQITGVTIDTFNYSIICFSAQTNLVVAETEIPVLLNHIFQKEEIFYRILLIF